MNSDGWKHAWKIALVAVVLGGLTVAGRYVELYPYLDELRSWIWSFGSLGPVVFVGIYVGATLLGAPGTPLTILAALVFGTIKGVIVMIVATTLAASIGFLIARFVARDWIRSWLSGNKLYEKLSSHLESDGLAVVVTIRLLPIYPFTMANYSLGLSEITFWRFLLYSELAMIPMNVVLVFGAEVVLRATLKGEIPWSITLGAVGAAAIIATAWHFGKEVLNGE